MMKIQLIALATGLALVAAPAVAKPAAKKPAPAKMAKKPTAKTMAKPAAAPAAAAPAAPPAPPVAAAPAAAAKKAYTTADTTIGDLLDDPAAKAILVKHMPGLLADSRIEQARGFTLKAIQPMAGGAITDEKLAAIDADLAALAAGK